MAGDGEYFICYRDTSKDVTISVPDTTKPKFDEKIIESDVSINATDYGTTFDDAFLVYEPSSSLLYIASTSYSTSGTSEPSSDTNRRCWYDTNSNIVKMYAPSSSSYVSIGFPIANISTLANTSFTIKQIFDWCGYIGSTAFVLPNVKGLIPDGFNANETYKSIEFETDKVLISNKESNWTQTQIQLMDANISHGLADYDYVYDKSNNVIMMKEIGNTFKNVAWGSAVLSSGKITSLTPYEVKTTNDTIDIKEVHQCVGKTNCLTELPNDINLELDPLNVTVVGTPKNSNGVVSGFSTSNYLIFNGTGTVPADNLNSFEIAVKVTTPTTWTSNGRVINPTNGADSTTAPFIQITNSVAELVWYNGTTWSGCSQDISLTSNTTYWFKWIYDGSTIKGYYSTDGSDYILSKTTTLSYKPYFNSTEMGIGCRVSDKYASCVWNGSVDLKETYIKVNGKYWWQGGTGHATLKSGSKVYVPNGFEEENYYKYNVTKIGSPTLTNGIANNFSVGNLLTLNDSFNVEDKNWEVGVKITTGSSISGSQTIWGSIPDYNGFLLRANNGTVTLWLSTNGTSWNGLSSVASTLVLQPNTTYYIKLSFNGTQYLIDASNDGVNYNNYLTHSSTVLMIENHSTIGGHGVTTSLYDTPFLGSIDLTQSYIKINDEIWWSGITDGTSDDYDYITYSGERIFDEVIIDSDLIRESSKDTAGDYLIFYYPEENKVSSIKIEETSSGASYPTSTTEPSWVYYNTTENKILYTSTSGTDWIRQYGFPVAIVEADALSFIKIKQIFNGFGYIGSTIFVLPGVKGLSSKGYKNNGVYNNIDILNDKVMILSREFAQTNPILIGNNILNQTYLYYIESDSMPSTNWTIWRNTLTNEIKVCNSVANEFVDLPFDCVYVGTTTRDESFKITDMNILPIKTTNDTKVLYAPIELSPELGDDWIVDDSEQL